MHRQPAEAPPRERRTDGRVGGIRLVRLLVARSTSTGLGWPASVWDALGPQEQVGLRTVLADAPLQQGLAELIGYLSLAVPGLAVIFDGQHREQVSWCADDEEVERVAELPRVSFTRDRAEGPDERDPGRRRGGSAELSVAVVNLLKGPIYRDTHETPWALLLAHRNEVDRLRLRARPRRCTCDEAEGYAYLRSRPADDVPDDIPRLVARRPLSFQVSMLLALLRESGWPSSTPPALILDWCSAGTRSSKCYGCTFPKSTNEARLVDSIETHINRVVEMGFLRKLRGQEDLYEVRRIIKAYVDGQWLSDFDARLEEYVAELRSRGAG